ncbi:predicted protein [Naegleria gruberi]|uniref:Predicted protein n=1 Tax=Naegleria gruberi TaxID=5762 RepID=D2UY54_NAEGR|nr:uncharacterized protein NAEGRDRAFT_61350 [Naegleria gruberi]EFC50416.1 predicted protein [Naegleria gruberi]|eukprot:XP_002683160.1 predicted protein [Naegleria gruberi strain NEG-M]
MLKRFVRSASICQSSICSHQHSINFKIITLLNRRNFHNLPYFQAILSEKDFEKLEKEQQTEEDLKPQSKSPEIITNTTSENPSSPPFNNSDDPSLFAEFMKMKKKEEHDMEGYNNPFYRDVDEKTAIEYQDAINDKESTPFPTWMMNFYRVASISVVVIVCYGLVVAKLDEQSINERYALLEKKRNEREEQMRNMQFELELTTSVKEKKSLFSGLKALVEEEK